MVLVIIILVAWIVILGPSLIKRRARSGGDQSITHFHYQLRVLEHSAPEPLVAPAYRLRAVDGTGSPTGITYPDTYRALAAESPIAAIAGLAAYESQAAAIATSKGDGLRRWYGMDAAGTRFWDVHSTMDADHGEWSVEALALLGADAGEVADGARRAADAWWALLDERQAEGVAA